MYRYENFILINYDFHCFFLQDNTDDENMDWVRQFFSTSTTTYCYNPKTLFKNSAMMKQDDCCCDKIVIEIETLFRLRKLYSFCNELEFKRASSVVHAFLFIPIFSTYFIKYVLIKYELIMNLNLIKLFCYLTVQAPK